MGLVLRVQQTKAVFITTMFNELVTCQGEWLKATILLSRDTWGECSTELVLVHMKTYNMIIMDMQCP